MKTDPFQESLQVNARVMPEHGRVLHHQPIDPAFPDLIEVKAFVDELREAFELQLLDGRGRTCARRPRVA